MIDVESDGKVSRRVDSLASESVKTPMTQINETTPIAKRKKNNFNLHRSSLQVSFTLEDKSIDWLKERRMSRGENAG